MKRKALCVLGMHRSGTSAVAGSLIHGGIPGPNTPVPAAEDNPLGFWEPLPIVQLHDQLLGRMGLSWESWDSGIDTRLQRSLTEEDRQQLLLALDAEFGDSPVFVVKDPRMCLTLPLWRELCATADIELCPIVVVRSPLEVALSLQARDQFDLEASALMWLRYNLLAERWTRDLPRAFLSFDHFMQDSRSACRQILARFGIEAPAALDTLNFVVPELRHHHRQEFEPFAPDKLRQQLQTLHADLSVLAQHEDGALQPRFDAATLALDRLLAERPELQPQRGMVTRVQLSKQVSGVLGFNLELPQAGSMIRHRMLDFMGWLLPESSEQAPALELWQGDTFCGDIRPHLPRADVAQAFPDATHAAISGFKCRIPLVPQQPYLTLDLRQPAADGTPGQLMARIAAWLPPTVLPPDAQYLPLAAKLLEQGDRLGADQALNTAISMLRVEEVDTALALAEEYQARGRSERYGDILRRILHCHPEHAETHVRLMKAYKQQQNYAAALEVLGGLLQRHPTWLSLHLESALVLQAMGRHEEAIAHLRRYLATTPEDLPAILALADSLLASGDAQAAASSYEQALQLQADADGALLGLAQALQQLAAQQLDAARSTLQRARQLCQQALSLQGETPELASLQARIAGIIPALEAAARGAPTP